MQRDSRLGGRPSSRSDSVGKVPGEPANAPNYDEILQRYSDQAILNADPACLTATQLERRRVLLRERKVGGGKQHQAARRRVPCSRRLRQAGRAETAAMATSMPAYARIELSMTPATVRVYCALWALADSACYDPSVPEIAARAKCSEREVQRALTALKLSGHLTVTYRRRRPRMNDTNVYGLIYHRGVPLEAAARGDNFGGVTRKKESLVATSANPDGCSWKRHAPGRRAESDYKIAPPNGSACTFRAIRGGAATAAQRRAGFDTDVGRLTIVSLKTLGVTSEIAAHDCDAICTAVDRLRRRYFPGFSPGFWERSVSRLGFRAYLAVIEVVEIAAVKQIDNMAAYLGGVLRKPTDEVRPDVTLTRLQYSAAA